MQITIKIINHDDVLVQTSSSLDRKRDRVTSLLAWQSRAGQLRNLTVARDEEFPYFSLQRRANKKDRCGKATIHCARTDGAANFF